MDEGARDELKMGQQRAGKKSTVRPFRQSLPMLLMRCREVVISQFRQYLYEQGLTEQQWRILRVLAEHEQVELLELSARCLIKPPSLSRTVPALAERGLVNRRSHPEDHRRVRVSLTPAGRELFETMAAETERIYAQLDARLGAADLLSIYEMLDRLVDVLEAAPQSPDDSVVDY
jgi:homoprotocatechuate degradation regulator HpaR